MNTDTQLPTLVPTLAEIVEAEGVTADSCLKAAWVLTEALNDALNDLNDFKELFAKFAKDAELGPIFRDAVGVAWALDQFCGLQWGQLPYWANPSRFAERPEGETKQAEVKPC